LFFLEACGMSESLDTLFRQCARDLNRLAHHRLGCPEDAADVVQDAFVRYAGMVEKGTTEHVVTPRFFLSRIVSNLIIDRLRVQRRRGVHGSLDEAGLDIVDPRPAPSQLLEYREQLKLLAQALDELPENCRKAILLNRLEGYTHKQIAEQLGVSSSMVTKYIMRALKHCAIRLGTVA
jgi:RNA polymerase sigma-70 factor (ECF subfamily)